MDVRQLRYALAVVDEGTFTAAATACAVAQPSLSQSVRSLEIELGVELFLRVGRRVVLTAAGEAFVPAARSALRTFEAVRDEVQAVLGLVAGHLDVVALPTLALDPVARLVGGFRRAHPQVVVRLAQPDGTEGLLRSVRSGDADVGITEMPAAADGLVVRPFGRQEIVAVLPPGSPRRRRLTAADLGALALVTQPIGTSTRALLDSTLAAVGSVARVAVEADQREAIVPLVLEGAGAALLPRAMADRAREQGAVVAPLDPPLERELALVHRDGLPAPATRAFLDIALGVGASTRPPPTAKAPARQ